MSKLRLLLAAVLALGLSAAALRAAEPPAGAAAEASLDALLNAIQANRKALVAANLGLTDGEAAGFWPVYDRYAKEIAAIGDRLVAVIQDYTASFSDLSDDKAMKLVDGVPRHRSRSRRGAAQLRRRVREESCPVASSPASTRSRTRWTR